MDGDSSDEVLDAEQVSALLRVTVQTVLKESRLGLLPGVKVGREWRYSRQALMRHLSQYAGAPAPHHPAPGDEPDGRRTGPRGSGDREEPRAGAPTGAPRRERTARRAPGDGTAASSADRRPATPPDEPAGK